MIALAGLGVVALIVALPFLSAFASIYNAYWAVKIWALLIVPTTGLKPLPMAAAAGFALVLTALRPLSSAKDDEDKSGWERFFTALFQILLMGPLVYLVAKIAAHWLL